MKFFLRGAIIYYTGSCYDACSLTIEEEFNAESKEEGIEKARALIQKLHNKYVYRTDYSMCAVLSVVKERSKHVLWEIEFVDDQPAQAARKRQVIKAQKAIPAVPAHLKEITH